jgi:hypothetical protein
MKRLVLSVAGGVAFPLLYAVIVGPLTLYIEDRRLREIMSYPVRWPIVLLDQFLPGYSYVVNGELELLLLSYIVVADVLLYSILTYILLWRFWKSKSEPAGPPAPPQFTNTNSGN